MANVDSPNGLWPLANPNGTTPQVKEYTVAATYAAAIGKGSPVLLSATGPQVWVKGNTHFIGVAANHVGASTTITKQKLSVYNDPNQLYHIQTDANDVTTLAGYEGANFSLINPGTVSSTTLQSAAEIQGASATASTTVIAQCVGPYKRIDQVVNTSFTRLVVKVNPAVHHYAKPSGTAI